MRVVVVVSLWVGFALFLVLTVVAFVAAELAYDEASSWFGAATYLTECAPGRPGEGLPGCASLAADTPTWPAGVPVTDTGVLLAEGAAVHGTGSAVLSIAGILLGVAGLFASLALAVGSRPTRTT